MNKNKKRAIIVAGSGLAALAALVIMAMRKKKRETIEPYSDIETNDVPIEIVKSSPLTTNHSIQITQQGSSTTISSSEAQEIADTLYDAMDKFGTDEETVFQELEGLNQADLLLVINKFGERKMSGAYGIKLGKAKSLIDWIKSEFSGYELDKVKEIFESNGINF